MALDARVRYTKNMIRESFIQLYAQKPITQITVKDICEKAGINRSTFYRNYVDVYDLKDQLENEMLENMLELIHDKSIRSAYQTMLTILNAMKENRDRYLSLRIAAPSTNLLTSIIRRSYTSNKDRVMKLTSGASETQVKWYFEYICTGCAGVFIDWAQHGMQEPTEEVARFLADMIQAASAVLKLKETAQ